MRKSEPRPLAMPKWPPDAPFHCGMHDCEPGHDHQIVIKPNNPYVAFMVCRAGCAGHDRPASVDGKIPCGSLINLPLIALN